MKIVIATGIFPPDIGGPATFVPMMAGRWSDAGHRVAVVTYSDKDDGEARPYVVHRISRRLSLPLRYASYFSNLWKEARDASVIFAQDPVAAGVPALLCAWFLRKKLVLKFVGDFAWEHARVQEKYEGSLEEFQKERKISFRIRCLRSVQRWMTRRADTVIVPSRYLADLVRGWGVKEAGIRLIYNGVRFPEVSSPGERKPHRILTVGRFVPWKGFDTLISAMPHVRERVPDAELVIVGDGPDEERLRERADVLGLGGCVRFTGRLPAEDVARALVTSGVTALVSQYEGFSHQLVASFMSGTPVVASREGGNVEIVRDGENGLLVPYGDVKATADALVRLLQHPDEASRMARSALEDSRRFTVEEQVRRTTETVCGGPRARVVAVSRDVSIADPSSRAAARMRRYADRLGNLRLIIPARQASKRVKLSDRAEAEIVDARNLFAALPRLIRATARAVRETDADLIVAQDPFETGIAAAKVSFWTKRPYVVEEHGGVFLGTYWKDERLKNRLMHPIGLLVLRWAAGARAVSRKIADDLRRRFPKLRIATIPVYTEPTSCPSSGPPRAFGYVGRYVPQKNLIGLLRAFHTVWKNDRASRLLLAGAGPLEKDLRRIAAEFGVGEAVEWLPFSEDVGAAYARIGTLVLPSWYEGWGRVVVEAMQCGIPVVMTDVGCAGEVVRDGTEGRIVPVGDMEAFAAAMRHVADPGRHPLLSVAARKRAVDLETPEQLVIRLTDFWNSFAGKL